MASMPHPQQPLSKEMALAAEEENFMLAMNLANSAMISRVLRTVVELDLLNIIAKAGQGGHLSASDIASQLPATNPDAAAIIDRMLRLLSSYSIINCTVVTSNEGPDQRLYGLSPVTKYFIPNEDGVSIAPFVLMGRDKTPFAESWAYLKDAVLEGSTPFTKASGVPLYEYIAGEGRIFSDAMYNITTIHTKKVLQTYKGFEGIKELVDVGGGLGANLKQIVSMYPHIKGINFDLPDVVKNAPPCPGIEHVGGDMFKSVPKAEAIFLKFIIHNWSDDKCLKLLKNCYEALPESGKVIIVDAIIPESAGTDVLSRCVFNLDMAMLIVALGGRERTEKEFEALAKGAGFETMKLACRAHSNWVIELYKKAR